MSKLGTTTLAGFSLLLSNLALAEVQIVIPSNIDLIAVDGLKPQFEQSDDVLILPDGEHQIVFKYQPSIKVNDGLQKVYSDTQIAKFSATDSQLQFQLPQYSSYNKARQEIKQLEWALLDQQGQSIDLAIDTLNTNGVQWGRNYIQDVMDYNAKGGVAALTTVSSVGVQIKAQPLPVAGDHIIDSENLAQLKLWYSQATSAERKAFQKWVIDQN